MEEEENYDLQTVNKLLHLRHFLTERRRQYLQTPTL